MARAPWQATWPGSRTGAYKDGHESPRAWHPLGCGLRRDRCGDDAVRRASRPNNGHAVASLFQSPCDRLSERQRLTSHALALAGALVGLLISLPDAFALHSYVGIIGTGLIFG